MSELKFTPGPWHVGEGQQAQIVYDKEGWGIANAVVFHSKHSQGSSLANAKLIASAPDLLNSLKDAVKSAEQSEFESWLNNNHPSGDCESVHSQWIESAEYSDFVEVWKPQIDAIEKATA